MRTRGSCKASEEKWRKKFVGQQLGVTPRSWLTPKRWLLIWYFLRFSSCISHEPLVRMMERVLFSSFFNIFHSFQPCECMRKHAFPGQNTQQFGSILKLVLTGLVCRKFGIRDKKIVWSAIQHEKPSSISPMNHFISDLRSVISCYLNNNNNNYYNAGTSGN